MRSTQYINCVHFFKKKENENENFVIKLYSIHCKYSFFTQFHSPVHRDKNIQINILLSCTELSYIDNYGVQSMLEKKKGRKSPNSCCLKYTVLYSVDMSIV